jgi:hypothetical protein
MFLLITAMLAGTASAALRWDKAGFDAESRIFVSPNYQVDQSLFALVEQDLFLSLDGGKTWDKTSIMPVWHARVEQDNNFYIMQGADRNSMAIYKYNYLAEGGWEKVCNAPAGAELFTVMDNGTVIAVKPGTIRSVWNMLRAVPPSYTWQDTGYTRSGPYLESTPDGMLFTIESGTGRLYKSITHGLSWREVKPAYEMGQFYISPAYSSDGRLYTIVNRTSLYLSYDRGENWQKRMTGMGSSSYLAGLAFSPDYRRDQTMYMLDTEGRVFISGDASYTWKSYGIYTESGAEFNSLAVLPGGRLLAGAGDGIYEVGTYIPPARLARAVFVIDNITYTLGQNSWYMGAAPYIEEGRAYVPVRYLAYALGMDDNDVIWDAAKNEVTLKKNKVEVKMIMGSSTLLVNNQPVTMDVTPRIRVGRVFLPARWVAEAFEAVVTWDEQSRSVIVDYEK